MLITAGEAIAAFCRIISPGQDPQDAAVTGPWASGAPAICAYVAGGLGTPTRFLSAVGGDAAGRTILERLHVAGVDASYVAVVAPLPTATATVTYAPDGSRSFDFRTDGSAIGEIRSDAVAAACEGASWFHLSGASLLFGPQLEGRVLYALTLAQQAGARISVDPNVRPEVLGPDAVRHLARAVSQADVVFPSSGELEALGLCADGLMGGGAVVVETHGKRGARVGMGGAWTEVPAPRVDCVDADGAGDTFAAGFIAASLAGADPVAAARVGTQAAAIAVQVPGPMQADFGSLRAQLDELR